MNHRYEYQRVNRVMGLNTALRTLGIKKDQLNPGHIKYAVKHRCKVIQQEPNKSVRNRHYEEMEEARSVINAYLDKISSQSGVQLQLFEFMG